MKKYADTTYDGQAAMTGEYRQRARYYCDEFSTQLDFKVLKALIRQARGSVVDIPCGSGRLLPLHLQHQQMTFMIDLEPAMVHECRKRIRQNSAEDRIQADTGDLQTWSRPLLASTVLIARGGLQLLPNLQSVIAAIANVGSRLSHTGVVYIDLAQPWTQNCTERQLLPTFMRFESSEAELTGTEEFLLPDNAAILRRTYNSKLGSTYVDTTFSYVVTRDGAVQDQFESKNRWLRIDPLWLVASLDSAGLSVMSMVGTITTWRGRLILPAVSSLRGRLLTSYGDFLSTGGYRAYS